MQWDINQGQFHVYSCDGPSPAFFFPDIPEEKVLTQSHTTHQTPRGLEKGHLSTNWPSGVEAVTKHFFYSLTPEMEYLDRPY